MFNKEIFDSMIAGGAFDKAHNYLVQNRKLTVKGRPSSYALTLGTARERNKAKMRSRNNFAFSTAYVPSSIACKECGNIAETRDHIIPHTKSGQVSAAAIRRICLRLKVNYVSIDNFLRSDALNMQNLCPPCNAAKQLREMSIAWRNVRAVAKFYFTEKARVSSDLEREIRGKYSKVIGRAKRNINAAQRNGRPSKTYWNTLNGIHKRLDVELKKAGISVA